MPTSIQSHRPASFLSHLAPSPPPALLAQERQYNSVRFREFVGAGRIDNTLADLSRSRDAAEARIVSPDVDLHMIRYPHEAQRARDVFLDAMPPGEKLSLVGLCSVSWHVGDTAEQQAANAKNYAHTNRYEIKVWRAGLPEATAVWREFGIKRAPEYASASDPVVLDLSHGHDMMVSLAPVGSLGRSGYASLRTFLIHNPRKVAS